VDGSEGIDDAHRAYTDAALFLMSANCEHPTLTPACPFSVEVRPGVRNCEEQCHAVLAERGLPLPTYADAPAAPAPTKPFSVAAAFDACALYLQAQERRPARWPLPALIWALKQHLTGGVVDTVGRSRDEEVQLCLQELARRDFDVDALVRWGMGRDIVEAVLMGTVIPRLAKTSQLRSVEVSETPHTHELPDLASQWHDLLDDVLALEAPDELQLLFNKSTPEDERRAATEVAQIFRGTFLQRLHTWMATAPLADIVSWAPPPSLDGLPASTSAAQPPAEDRQRQRWLVDRFTVPYYNDWEQESRHLEFRWLRGDTDAPCAESLMDIRPRREDDLARTIAVATVLAPVGPENYMSSLRSRGLSLLAEGRRTAAAAVLDSIRDFNWDLPEPHNDYGFALLPDDPEAALQALRMANNLGYTLTVNTANRALAYAMLDQPDQVYSLAEAVLINYENEDADDGILWAPGDTLADSARLSDIVSPRDYVIEVAALAAERAGDETSARRWRSELASRAETDVDESA
jgi:hypothetical protein